MLNLSINVLLVSEQLRYPADDVNWVFSIDGKCVVVTVGPLASAIKIRGSGMGFTWFKLRGLVIFSCYYTHNYCTMEFEEYFGNSDDSIRVY